MPPTAPATARRVLITAIDLFTGSGPVEADYRRLIERTPTTEFVYFSRGADLDAAGRLPANAHPLRLREDVRPRPFIPGPLPSRTVWRHRQLALAMAASVPGRWFDEVEVPAGMPLGDVIRDALALFGTHTRRLTLGVVDTADGLCAQDDVGRVQQAARASADGIVRRDEPALWPLLRVDAADPQPPDGDSDSTIESTLTVLMPWSGTASGAPPTTSTNCASPYAWPSTTSQRWRRRVDGCPRGHTGAPWPSPTSPSSPRSAPAPRTTKPPATTCASPWHCTRSSSCVRRGT